MREDIRSHIVLHFGAHHMSDICDVIIGSELDQDEDDQHQSDHQNLLYRLLRIEFRKL